MLETYLDALPGLCKGTCLRIYYVVLLLYYIASRWSLKACVEGSRLCFSPHYTLGPHIGSIGHDLHDLDLAQSCDLTGMLL